MRLYCCVTGRGAAVGNSFVDAGKALSGNGAEANAAVDVGADEGSVAGADTLLVGVGTVIDAVVCVDDWASALWVSGGRPVVCTCSLHPHRNSPTTAQAIAIWIFRIGFIFVIPYFRLNRGVTEP